MIHPSRASSRQIWLVKPSIPSPAAMASAAASAQGLPAPSPHPPRVEYLATLSRHSGVVNCVRFSPSGDLLASAGDDGTVMLWHLTDRPVPAFGDIDEAAADTAFEKEHWRMIRMIRVSTQEIYDMAWSPNGEHLVVGGTDFVARVINPHDGTILKEYSDHAHYVQGVAWDPLDSYLATQSSDRSVHVHALHHTNTAGSGGAQSSSGKAHHASSSGYVPPVTRNSKMDVHRRTQSGSAGAWDSTPKPSLHRGNSHTSHIESDADDSAREDHAHHSSAHGPRRSNSHRESFAAVRGRTGRSHTPMDPPHTVPTVGPTAASAHSTSATTPHLPARAATPTPASSVPQSPAFSTASTSAHPMNPPQRTPSRRSSFSGSQAEGATSPPTSIASFAHGAGGPSSAASIYKAAVGGGGPTAETPQNHHSSLNNIVAGQGSSTSSAKRLSLSRAASIRSPSPAPLPAIRPPPSPRQRIHAAQQIAAGSAGGAAAAAAYSSTSSSASMAAVTPLQVGMRMYGDEAFSGFFRRLAFSPDGALLVTPSGIFESNQTTPASPSYASSPTMSSKSPGLASPSGPRSTVYLYGRGSFGRPNAPIAHLPGHKTATLVVRFSPILYELRKTHSSAFAKSEDGGGVAPHPSIPLEAGKQKSVSLDSQTGGGGKSDGSGHHQQHSGSAGSAAAATANSPPPRHDVPPPPISMIGLPYRMVFAVATHDVVWIYDTQQGGPLCCFSNMHYASFTDLTWSADGQTLIMSSSDGYCSVAVFDYGELGQPYVYNAQPSLRGAASGQHGSGASAGANANASVAAPAPANPTTPAVNTLTTKKKKPQTTTTATTAALASSSSPTTSASLAPASTHRLLSSSSSSSEAEDAGSVAATGATAAGDAESKKKDGEAAAAARPAAAGSEQPKKKRRIQPTLHSSEPSH